jgi:hypothetical protein
LPVENSFFADGISSVTYGGDGFTINVKDILAGGTPGSGASAINETITVSNTDQTLTDAPLQFRISDYVDLNVNGTPNNDTLTLSPGTPNTAEQTDPSGAAVNFSVTPTPNEHTLFRDFSGSNSLGPSTGNEAFNFVWDLSIDPDSSAQISINEVLSGQTAAVPLPNSALSGLFTLGGLGAIGIFRRTRRTV